MKRRMAAIAVVAGAGALQAEEVVTPSGLSVEFLDRIVETQADGETWLTLRFVTPRIGDDEGELGYDQVADDIDALCDIEGVKAATETGKVDQLMIALMDRAVQRGEHDPEATMFIGAYLLTEGGCVWQ
ncbi:hypothetical protein SAMN04488026_103112 [Aliiruegeria lutimaris]|uniref:Uncharacterized protein n=2 Tax=Aliiruegeria lutimaris TaxID=571298 RepID=A0A1G8Z4Z4_9RHOB|nr:hypothetical protein SAMN04488026_103112 [Aliiruegeria lutimaris]